MLKPSFSSLLQDQREKSKKGKSASFLLRAFLSPKNQVDHTESRESFQLEKNQLHTETDRQRYISLCDIWRINNLDQRPGPKEKEVLLTLSYHYQNLLI